MGDLVSREEAEAALEARRELGVEYEDEVVDALVDKIEQRLAERRPLTPRAWRRSRFRPSRSASR